MQIAYNRDVNGSKPKIGTISEGKTLGNTFGIYIARNTRFILFSVEFQLVLAMNLQCTFATICALQLRSIFIPLLYDLFIMKVRFRGIILVTKMMSITNFPSFYNLLIPFYPAEKF